MEKKVEIVVVSVVIGLILLVMLPVQAIPTDHASRTLQPGGDVNERITKHLEKLEDAGYDVSEIRAAVESGDMETARTLLREFMEEHRDEFPSRPGVSGQDIKTENSDHITKHLEKLEDAGYDVSEIRAAVESGDMETARTLLREFMEEHRDEFPANQKGGMRGTHCRTAILEE